MKHFNSIDNFNKIEKLNSRKNSFNIKKRIRSKISAQINMLHPKNSEVILTESNRKEIYRKNEKSFNNYLTNYKRIVLNNNKKEFKNKVRKGSEMNQSKEKERKIYIVKNDKELKELKEFVKNVLGLNDSRELSRRTESIDGFEILEF